ncbi:MAG: hypothetical protein HRF51_07605 [bacterium]|jgi:methyl-accepting chemotaxis protein
MTDSEKHKSDDMPADWHLQIDELAGQVKVLALNLAISLAKAKNDLKELTVLEPEFTRLINGSVEVIKEITTMLKAFRNEEKMVYTPPSQNEKVDRIEGSLNEILSLSQAILKTVGEIKKKRGMVDNYR